jgi:hypothetical protein
VVVVFRHGAAQRRPARDGLLGGDANRRWLDPPGSGDGAESNPEVRESALGDFRGHLGQRAFRMERSLEESDIVQGCEGHGQDQSVLVQEDRAAGPRADAVDRPANSLCTRRVLHTDPAH